MTRLIATPEHIKAIIRDYAPWQAEKPQFRPDLACQAFDSEADGTTIKLHAADSGAPEDDRWFVIVCPGYGADRYLVNLTKAPRGGSKLMSFGGYFSMSCNTITTPQRETSAPKKGVLHLDRASCCIASKR